MREFAKEYTLLLLGSKVLVNTYVRDGRKVTQSSKIKIENKADVLGVVRDSLEKLGYRENKSYSNVA